MGERLLFFVFSLVQVLFLEAQIRNPVQWSTKLQPIQGDTFELVFKASIQRNWAVYSMYLKEDDDGPIPTTISYSQNKSFKLLGKAKEEGNKKEGYDPFFDMNVIKFLNNYTIRQRLVVQDYSKNISGYLNFMTCDDQECLPPTDVDFDFKPVKIEGQGSIDVQGAIQGTKDVVPALVDENMEESGRRLDIKNPVQWKGYVKRVGDLNYQIVIQAEIDKQWNIYSQKNQNDIGPIPTSIIIEEDQGQRFTLKSWQESGTSITEEYDQFFDLRLYKIKGSVTYKTEIQIEDPMRPLKGYIDYMACDSVACLTPEPVNFEIRFNEERIVFMEEGVVGFATETKGEGTPVYFDFDFEMAFDSCESAGVVAVEEKTGWWWIFIFGFIGGLLAILTPCVFPMIPLTISYFTKSSESRSKGISNATTYGLSIIVIYLLLGLLITGIFGADALNLLSTNAWFNIAFGILFIVFGISFFGYFEITLPSSWVNRADEASNKAGLLGIFFMAFTLSLVSFSCTGPIIGTLLVETARGNTATLMGYIPINPLIGMFGFSLALALPFGIFAAFPGWLNSLPRSGNWMNSIKVTLGFIEIALALKFFSIADLTMGWKWLPYELFLFLWILCAVGLALYYFGLIKFPHDHGVKEISNLRKILGFSMLGLAIYFATGFRYSEKSGTFATPNLLSGLAPPAGHSFIYPKKCPLNLDCFKDFYEGIAVAKSQNKPVMIDFTGHGCVNCRRMEDQVWGQPGIFEMLRDKYVIISLYVDERKALEEPYVSTFDQKLKRTVGNKWADFQQIHFGRNSQPYYVLATADGLILNKPVAYTPDILEYKNFLSCGLQRFAEISGGKNILGSTIKVQ